MYSVPPFIRIITKTIFVKIPPWTKLLVWVLQNIFAGLYLFDFCPNMAIPHAKPYVAAPGAGLECMPMGAQA
jgi:hypothetical protein